MNKQIEEMAHDMCEYYYEGTCYQDKKPCDCKCDIFTDAEYLYAKGYRKSVDVARDVAGQLKEIAKQYLLEKGLYLAVFKNALNHAEAELKKKYESEGADDD